MSLRPVLSHGADLLARQSPWIGGGRCVSLTVNDRPCWRRVVKRGQRCTHCWRRLVVSPTTSHRVELAAEPDLPAWVTTLLVEDPEPMVRMVVAGRFDIAAEFLRRLGGDPDPGVRSALADNESLPADVAVRLAADPDSDIVIRLAARPGVARAVLAGLGHHSDARVRGALAGNTGADEHLDRTLASHEIDPVVLAALAAKTTTSALVLTWLAQHPAPLVAEPAARQLRTRSAQEGVA
ncbi:MAG: hypothetical protein M3137_20690 [Actinomycetota bacterium]|nr:hypothetical protein [Actinomycetota bacterium]